MKKILVVDDSVVQCNHMYSILSTDGHDVKLANDGKEIVDLAKNYQPDLIFMDVNMPEVDGFSATRQLKSNTDTKDIPVCFLTSKDQKADKVWGQILGATAYLVKPYQDQDVLQQVRAL